MNQAIDLADEFSAGEKCFHQKERPQVQLGCDVDGQGDFEKGTHCLVTRSALLEILAEPFRTMTVR